MARFTLPLLGVYVGMETPPALRALLVAASTRCRPVACSPLEAPPDPVPGGFVWAGSSARPPAGSRYAAWVGAPDELTGPVPDEATVLLCETPMLAGLAGERGLYVPLDVGSADARPVPPFVRRRLRASRGLPARVVVTADGATWRWDDSDDPLAADLVPTAAGCASAVVATGAALANALSWAAPAVTDPASAAELGAEHGTHVLVAATGEERVALAAELADDDARAAALSWAGWTLYRDRCDVRHAAWTMIRRLGLPAAPFTGRLATLDEQLDSLGTPAYGFPRTRSRSLVGSLPRRLTTEGELA